MPIFGPCETVSEIYHGAFSTVYRGRSQSLPGKDLAVKVLSLSTAFMDADSAAARSDRFLEIAQAQQKIAAGAEYWAPIYESGTSPEGAFYVTDCFERSLHHVIDGRAKLSPEVFHRIIESVMLGLVELKKTSNRPHGNLKLSNVLISDASGVPVSRVAITDPLPDSEVESQHWTGDLRFVGELIYQLIMHRPPNQLYTSKVAKTENWKTLGKEANGWVQLCNTLLYPSEATTSITLEDIATTVRLLRPKPNKTIPKIIATVVFLLVIAAIVWRLWPSPPPIKEEWGRLVNEYLVWGDDFCKNVKRVQEDVWRDAGLKLVLDSSIYLDYPKEVARANRLDPADMEYMDWLSDSLLEKATKAKTQEAQNAANTLRSFLTAGDQKAWPLLKRVISISDQLHNNGCTATADFLSKLIDDVEPPDAARQEQMIQDNETVDIVAQIKNILQVSDNLTSIAQQLDEIKQSEKSITDIDTKLQPFASAVAEELKNRLKSSDQRTVSAIRNIDNTLKLFNSQVTILLNNLKTVVPVAFGRDHDKGLEGMSFEDVNKISKSYQKINYPPDKDINDTLAAIKECQDSLQPVIQNPRLKDKGLKCDEGLEDLRTEVQEFEQRTGVDFIAMNIDNRKIPDAWDIVLERISVQKQEVLELVKQNEPPDKYFAKSMEFINSFSESDAIRKAGLERYKQIKARFGEKGGSDKSTDILYDPKHGIYTDCEDLKKKLIAFDDKRRQLDAKIDSITADKFDSIGIDATKLRQSYVSAREELIGLMLLPAEKPLPADIDTIDVVKAFDSNIDRLIELLDYIAVLNAHLADFYLLDETLDVDGRSPTVEEYAAAFTALSSTLQKSSIAVMFESKDSNLAGACDDIEKTIASLKKIEQSSDAAGIIRLGGLNETPPVAQGPNRVLVRSAWKKLQSTGFDPGERISAQTVSNLEQWYTGSGREEVLVNDLKTSVTKVYKGLLNDISASLESDLKVIEKKGVDTSGATYSEFKKFARTVSVNMDNAQEKLNKEGTAKSLDTTLRDALKTLDVDRRAASQLAATVSSGKWDNNLYHITRFAEDWKTRFREEAWLTNLTSQHEKYKKPDESFWADVKAKQIKITKMSELEGNKVETDLAGFQKTFDQETQKTVISDDLATVKQVLIEALKKIEDKLIPVFCRNLQWSETEKKVIFTDSAFNKDFEIVMLQGSDESQPYTKKKWLPVMDWDKLRDKEKEAALQESFFADFDKDKTKPCWPKYIRSKQDDSVILRYIPAGDINGKPFYMSIRETTYEQFNTFLKDHLNNKWDRTDVNVTGKILRKPPLILPQAGVVYYWTGAIPLEDFTLPAGITDKPVVWITFDGAGKYCSWLGKARLPITREHRLAADFSFMDSRENLHFAEKDMQEIVWKSFLLARPMERMYYPYPWGIFSRKAIASSSERMDVNEEMLNRVFPRNTSDSHARNGLHDVCGNVWEWCTDDEGKPVVCGYSCLTPEEFRDEKHFILDGTGTESDYKYVVEPNCDVGFRVVVDLPE